MFCFAEDEGLRSQKAGCRRWQLQRGRKVIRVFWQFLRTEETKTKFEFAKAVSMRGSKSLERREGRDISLKLSRFSLEAFASS